MKNSILLLTLAVLSFWLIGCSSESSDGNGSSDSLNTVDRDSIERLIEQTDSAVAEKLKNRLHVSQDSLVRFFEKYGVTGAFAMFDPQEGVYYYHNVERTSEPLIPASTFKIMHAMIALETGALADTSQVFKWDGKDRGMEAWNKDQTLRSAIKNSVVWVFQGLAKSIGAKRMQHYMNLAEYGNKDIGGNLDSFWLDGDLRISMQEQVAFLRALYREELPFSKKTMQTVKSMLVYADQSTYTITAKTGWAKIADPNPDLGWFVGYLTTKPIEQEVPKGYYFATIVDINKPEDAKAREAITLDILKHVGLM